MSILSVLPGPEWFEPADLEDEDDDLPPPAITADVLTVTGSYGWWTAAQTEDE
jgi:hypothetical protein